MLKRHIKCLAVLFFLPMFMFHQLQAQPGNDWIVHYGDDELYEGCNKVIPTQDGNYLLVGMSTDDTYDPPCDKDAYVMKVNREGDLIWDRYYGDYLEDYNHDSWEYASDAIELPDSSIILCGAIRNNLYEDDMGLWYCPLALNISGDGNFLWQQLYDSSIGSYFRNIIFLQDEFFALTGGNSRVLYANEDGDSLNVISCGRLIVRDFQHFPDESCSVYLSATSGHYGCDDVEIVKIDLDGNVIWSGVYGTRHDEDPQNMIRTSDGGYAITGYQRNVDDQSIFDTFICRVDPNGEDFWLQTYPHPELDAGRRILQTADGGFIVGGSVTFGNHNPDGVYLMRTDADGNLLWEETYHQHGAYEMSDLIHSEDGGYIFTSGGFDDFFLLKTASDPVSVPRLIDPAIIDQCQLQPCYPNPFNSSTTISFSLPLADRTKVSIYNSTGQVIDNLLDQNLNSGSYAIDWNAQGLPSGQYYCRLSIGQGTLTTKILLLN